MDTDTQTSQPEPTVPEETPLAGVPEGTVLQTPGDLPNEIVVYDFDEVTGECIGWHKEVQA